MDTTVLDMRKSMKDVMAALDRNERVTLTYRGHKKAEIVPWRESSKRPAAADHAAFGIWKNRSEIDDVAAFVRNLRQGRSF